MGQNCDQNGYNHHQVGVVVIPLPAQGHLNAILQLSHLIASYQIPVHYVSSATHNRQARVRAHEWDSPNSTNNIHFHDLQFLPKSSPPLPPPTVKSNARTNFPNHLLVISEASYLLRHPVSQLLRALSPKFRRIIVIHDSLMSSTVEDIKSIPNAESYAFHTSSAFTIFFTMWEFMAENDKPFRLGSDIPTGVPPGAGCSSPEFEKFIANQYKLMNLSSGRLYNTCRSLEGRYIDLLAKLPANKNKKLYAIGPINQLKMNKISSKKSKIMHRCLGWLDEQEKDSVIYVSFGTTTSMTEAQIRELAIGLEKSEKKFIWVLRDSDKVDIFKEDGVKRGHDQLPKGYEERVAKRGIIVRDWAPQVEILGHPATGGFMSHCGWNSCIESISMGVPIATWPIHSDQPKNSLLVTEVLRVGVVVKDWAHRDEVVTSSVVEKAVRRLMGSKEGKQIRKRARELGVTVSSSATKGGNSYLEMDSFVAHITR